MMPMADQSYNRHLKNLYKLAKRFRKDRSSSAKRVACLRINYSNASAVDYIFKLADKRNVVGEFSFANAANEPEQPFAFPKAVDCNNIICPVRKDCFSRNLKSIKAL